MFFTLDNYFNFDGNKMKKILFVLMLVILSACAGQEPNIKGFSRQKFIAQNIELTGQVKEIKAGQKLRVYIDGNAKTTGLFKKKTALPNPVAAQLAQKDKYPYVLYLNRPCYFSDNSVCTPPAWEEGRYLPEIIEEMKVALLRLQQKYKIPEFELVGYDGGAAIALLLANRMKGIPVKVYTIAGILNTEQYALLMDEPLHSDTLNPAKEAFMLSYIPQVHLVGGKDKQVPMVLTKDYTKRVKKPISMQVKSYPSADHFNWAQFKIEY